MAIPTVAVLLGILLNRQDVTSIRGEIIAMRTDFHNKIDGLRAEFKDDLHREIGGLRTEIIAFRENTMRDMAGLHERLAVVESKQQS
ncbi:MAG TPA: hypothetical protein VIJ79_08610 [Acidobacteriaceae bacterium]